MVEKEIIKDPNSELDYGFSWLEWLNGDTISASTWIVPTGLTKITENFSTTIALVWLGGGTVGETYIVTNRITTAGGRTEDRSILVIVKER